MLGLDSVKPSPLDHSPDQGRDNGAWLAERTVNIVKMLGSTSEISGSLFTGLKYLIPPLSACGPFTFVDAVHQCTLNPSSPPTKTLHRSLQVSRLTFSLSTIALTTARLSSGVLSAQPCLHGLPTMARFLWLGESRMRFSTAKPHSSARWLIQSQRLE